MPRELKNAQITHVSYVDKAANKRQFFLMKAEGDKQPNFTRDVKILTKADDEQMLVYGVVYEPGVEDAHDDFMTAAEIEKAAHGFMKDAQNIDTQHNFKDGAGEVVESYIAPQDFKVGEQVITKGSWVLVTKATPEIWDAIQKGEFTGYSMAGVAEVEQKDSVEKNFFKLVKDFFTKGEVTDKFNSGKAQRDFRAAFYLFEDVYYQCAYNSDSNVPDYQRLSDAAKDLGELLLALAAEGSTVWKSLEPIDKESDIVMMKKEELQQLMKEALEPVVTRLDSLEKAQPEAPAAEPVAKSEEGEGAKPEGESAEDIKKAFADIVKEALAPISARLDVVEKNRGISKAADADDKKPAETEVQKSIWAGLL
jgi:hypothetical protein